MIMQRREDARPGEFKLVGNRAGNTVFVAPDLVPGTIDQGFDLYRSLESPFQRAVFAMFLVAEIHPFADGNGRIPRIMMNRPHRCRRRTYRHSNDLPGKLSLRTQSPLAEWPSRAVASNARLRPEMDGRHQLANR
jgi:hypothetical protein